MRYHDITTDDMNNGDGLRVVLWVAGCEHHCKGCQNPMTWNPDDGLEFDAAARKELFEKLSKPYISGITLSGGDPLHCKNRGAILILIKEIRKRFPKKTVWLYTGYTWEEITQNKYLLAIVRHVDILVEGKFEEALKDVNYPWAGSTNQKVINVQETLQKGEVILHERN